MLMCRFCSISIQRVRACASGSCRLPTVNPGGGSYQAEFYVLLAGRKGGGQILTRLLNPA